MSEGRVTSVLVRDVKGCRFVEFNPSEGVTVLAGKNGAGKSSVIDAISYALGGKHLCPDVPIRRGEFSGAVELRTTEFADEGIPALVIRRTFVLTDPSDTESTDYSSELTVTCEDGEEAPERQTLLDRLVNKVAFDPLAFFSMKPVEQREQLCKLVGLDFTEHDAARDKLFADRTVVTRNGKQERAAWEKMPHHGGVPAVEIDITAKTAELNEAIQHNDSVTELEKSLAKAENGAVKCDQYVAAKEHEIKELEGRIAALRGEVGKYKSTADEYRVTAARVKEQIEKSPKKDTQALMSEIREADSVNAKVRANIQREQAGEKVKQLLSKHKELTDKIAAMDASKKKQITESKWPVAGLAVSDDSVLYNGIPLQQAEESARIRVSVAIAAASAPLLKLALVRNGSALDEDGMASLAQVAQEHGLQLIVERVGEKDMFAQVVIRDGVVLEDRRINQENPQ